MTRPPRVIVPALVAGLAAAMLVACAARAPAKSQAPEPATQPAAEPSPPLGERPDEVRARIRELDAEIARQLAAGSIEAPDRAAADAAAATPMADLRATCPRSPRTTCQDVCKLGDSICDNAQAICDLAGQLPGDAWAVERCGVAKAACQRASDRCCRC